MSSFKVNAPDVIIEINGSSLEGLYKTLPSSIQYHNRVGKWVSGTAWLAMILLVTVGIVPSESLQIGVACLSLVLIMTSFLINIFKDSTTKYTFEKVNNVLFKEINTSKVPESDFYLQQIKDIILFGLDKSLTCKYILIEYDESKNTLRISEEVKTEGGTQ